MKILITYAYAGVGHKKAAEALENALSHFDKARVSTVDILDYTNAFFKFVYPRIYLFLIERAHFLWAVLYYFFDCKALDIFAGPLRRFFHNLQARRFVKFILGQAPDVIVCTHFFPAEVVSGLKRKNIFKGRLITVVTDFLPHSFWLARGSDYFIAAIERTKKDLVRRGVEEGKIKVLGIPCDPKFGISKDRSVLTRKLGLEDGVFNLLIMGGGFGTGPVKEIVYAINSLEPRLKDRIQMIVICGKNTHLLRELQGIGSHRLCAFGYMDNIDEFMEVSDCIVTKSGGLTVSESLSKNLPMIIIKPIPGQESRNCSVLTGYGVAVRANSVKEVTGHVIDLIDKPEKVIGMKTRMKLLAFPDAAAEAAEFILEASI